MVHAHRLRAFGLAVAVLATTACGVAVSSMEVDSQGNLYVVGDLDDSSGTHMRKYSPDGSKLWTVPIADVVDGSVQSISADRYGNVYLVGYAAASEPDGEPTEGSVETAEDEGKSGAAGGSPGEEEAGANAAGQGLLRKYADTGDELWSVAIQGLDAQGGATLARPAYVAADSHHGIYVVGHLCSDSDEWECTAAFLHRYASTGKLAWRLDGEEAETAATSVIGLTVDSEASAYVLARRIGAGEITLSKHGRGGTLLWQQVVSPEGHGEGAAMMDSDRDDGIYVAWTWPGSPGNATFLRRYTSAGEVAWTCELWPAYRDSLQEGVEDAAGEGGYTTLLSLTVDGNGSAYIASRRVPVGRLGRPLPVQSEITRYGSDGRQLWSHSDDAKMLAGSRDGSGFYGVSYSIEDGGGYIPNYVATLTRYSADGKKQTWSSEE